ncbi:MAG: Cobalt/magnesium transport protein CorA [Ilumatobacteraceae bacterium]|nr:Cobalt/magnesium transport protein CorA [Ilumatobacteraceae bacterium]
MRERDKIGAMAHTHSRVYREGAVVANDIDDDQISEALAEPGTIVWVDLCDPTEEDLQRLAAELGLHELAVEDALGEHQRPKLDRYRDHLFLTCQHTAIEPGSQKLIETEINAFIGREWLITVRKDHGFDIRTVQERWDRSPDLAVHGVSFLLYGLVDVVVDSYFDTLEVFDEYYDEISETIFGDHPIGPDKQQDWFQMRRALFRLHRLAVPLREALSSLMRRDHDAVAEDLYPYFQDVYDHILRITESTDALRDLVSTIVETNLSLRDYRQNQVMKKVTSWAAIIAVPTLITGYYGMNVKYPGLATRWGWISSLVLMAGLSIGLYAQFKKRDWL